MTIENLISIMHKFDIDFRWGSQYVEAIASMGEVNKTQRHMLEYFADEVEMAGTSKADQLPLHNRTRNALYDFLHNEDIQDNVDRETLLKATNLIHSNLLTNKRILNTVTDMVGKEAMQEAMINAAIAVVVGSY